MNDIIDNKVTQHLRALSEGLRYGSIHLVVHDGKVVRIERVERVRLTDSSEALDHSSG